MKTKAELISELDWLRGASRNYRVIQLCDDLHNYIVSLTTSNIPQSNKANKSNVSNKKPGAFDKTAYQREYMRKWRKKS